MSGLAAAQQDRVTFFVSNLSPSHFTNLLWFHGFHPGPFFSFWPSSISSASILLFPRHSISVWLPLHLPLSHSSPLITSITLLWRGGGSRLLSLTDRSWVQTSPRGRPYQWPSLAELTGSLLFLAALFASVGLQGSVCLCVCILTHLRSGQYKKKQKSDSTKDSNCNLFFNSN